MVSQLAEAPRNNEFLDSMMNGEWGGEGPKLCLGDLPLC